jgi:hypothetical protein
VLGRLAQYALDPDDAPPSAAPLLVPELLPLLVPAVPEEEPLPEEAPPSPVRPAPEPPELLLPQATTATTARPEARRRRERTLP